MSAEALIASWPRRRWQSVIGVPIDVLGWNEAAERIFAWARRGESRIVCVCDVNSFTQAVRNPTHHTVLASADMVTPDGAPIAWLLRRKGHRSQGRISGPDLMWACCRQASQSGTPMVLYGSTPGTLLRLEQRLRGAFPNINIVQSISPPFYALSPDEDDSMVNRINACGARIIWVGLGCPKQEAWLHAHKSRINAVMIGVGAALDFHAGVVKRAPLWMQMHGLEWCYRILQDPKRLAKRYLIANTIFIMACFGLMRPNQPVQDA